MGFIRLPTRWIRDGGLSEFSHHPGVLELKVLFALALAKGNHQRHLKKEVDTFPATLDTISDEAHVARPAATEGIKLLVARGLVARCDRPTPCSPDIAPRTSFFAFAPPTIPFFKFPVEHVQRSGLLSHLRLRNRRSLAALQVYLLLGAFRDNDSGVSRMGYDSMVTYGLRRESIKGGIDLLINSGLISVYRPDERDRTLQYRLQGIWTRAEKAASRPTGLAPAGTRT